jgi:hypothetical protein
MSISPMQLLSLSTQLLELTVRSNECRSNPAQREVRRSLRSRSGRARPRR